MRIAIMGNSGSGKSTLARQLSERGRIPILDLDSIAWLPIQPPTRRSLKEVRTELERFFAANDHWIVEGCYGEIIELACASGAELIFLNPGAEVCIENCQTRPWEPHKYPSKEAQDNNLEFLIDWVRKYEVRQDDCSLAFHRRVFENHVGPKREIASRWKRKD